MVTIYPKKGKPITVYEAVRAERMARTGTGQVVVSCFDASGREVASFLEQDIVVFHVMPDQTMPSIG